MSIEHTTWLTLQEQHRSGLVLRNTLSTTSGALHVVDGPHQGAILPLRTELSVIGRGPWCALSLPEDRKVSKEHCEVQLTEDGVRVRDLSSRNGVYIDHIRVMEGMLPPGSMLKIGHSQIRLEVEQQRQELELKYSDASQRIIGQSRQMRKLFAVLERLGAQTSSVLLTGETGTGKTTVAQAIHDQSIRRDGPFVAVNCSALPQTLAESLLFGHEKGAFTGADKRHKGYFEQAHGGTLFLDEIGDLPLALQPKLLDALESGRIQRLGSESTIQVDIRLISSTLQELHREVEQGRFRRDLYYRLAVVELHIPPLRERPEDIPLLIRWLLPQIAPGRDVALSEDAIKVLQDYLWPGNVRQLRNVLERAMTWGASGPGEPVFLTQQELQLPPVETGAAQPIAQTHPVAGALPEEETLAAMWREHGSLKELLVEAEKQTIMLALKAAEFDVPEAASALDISREWLYKRIKKYDLPLPRYKKR